MQVKKDEVRYAILREAEREFLQKGFLNASLRKIVKQAGTSIGNFYNYFTNKEMLYEELVKEEYESFLNFFHHHELAGEDVAEKLGISKLDTNQWRRVLSKVIQQLLPNLSLRFVLLMEGSKGTQFERTRLTVIKMIQEHFMDHIYTNKHLEIDSEVVLTRYAAIISEQFLDGLLMIIKKHQDEEIRQKLIIEHILFYIIGTFGIIGEENQANW